MTTQRTIATAAQALLAGSLALFGAGCGAEVEAGLTLPPDTPVVVVVIDTLRADRLSCYGYPLDTSPFLDELAARSFVFEANSSQCNATFPSLTSIFTGVYPKTHRSYLAVQVAGAGGGEQEGLVSLAERLDERGYHTVATASHPFWGVGELGAGALWRGWDSLSFIDEEVPIDDRPLWANAKHTNERLFAQLDQHRVEQGDAPLFLWAHYFDPHTDLHGNLYAPPEEHRNRYIDHHFEALGLGHLTDELRDLTAQERLEWIDAHFQGDERGEVRLAEGRASYDAEVRASDDGVRRLFERLEAEGILDRAVVVVMADHGENMEEYRDDRQAHPFTHGRLYEGVVHVPLLIHLPGQTQGRRISAMSQSIDVMPTLLELLDLAPDQAIEGRSLVPLMRGDEAALHEVVFSESSGGREKAVRSTQLKLIDGFNPGEREIYEWRVDVGEQENLAQSFAAGEPADLVAALGAFRPERRLQLHVAPMDEPFELTLRCEMPGSRMSDLEGLDPERISEDGTVFEWSGVVGPEGLDASMRFDTFKSQRETRWTVRHGGRSDLQRAVWLGRTPVNATPAIPIWRPVDGEPPRFPQVAFVRRAGGVEREVVVESPDARHIEYELRYRDARHDRRMETVFALGFEERQPSNPWMHRADAYDVSRARTIIGLTDREQDVLQLVRIDGLWPNPRFVVVDGQPVDTDELEFAFPRLPLDSRIPPYLNTQPDLDSLPPGTVVLWHGSGGDGGSIDRGGLSPELIRQLQDLGYIGEEE